LFAPGVGVLVTYVLVIGNPWLNRDIGRAVPGRDSDLGLVGPLVFYPSWQVDQGFAGPFGFWLSNLRTVLFVALGVLALNRVARWLPEPTRKPAVFSATVGSIAVSAVVAALTAAVLVPLVLGTRPFFLTDTGIPVSYLTAQLTLSASFGVLFGVLLAAVVVGRTRAPLGAAGTIGRTAGRRPHTPKSFW
jgi:hypothetical protein